MCDNRQWDAYLQNFRTEVTSSDLALYSENERDVYRDVYIVNGYAMVIVWISKWACSNHNNMYNITQLFTHQMSSLRMQSSWCFFFSVTEAIFFDWWNLWKGAFRKLFLRDFMYNPLPPPPHIKEKLAVKDTILLF